MLFQSMYLVDFFTVFLIFGKKPVFNISPLFGAKYVQLIGVGFEVMRAQRQRFCLKINQQVCAPFKRRKKELKGKQK